VFYYFSDHLKTASVVTDSTGNIKADSDYYPWGGELQFVNNDSNRYKFTGKERDSESGLDYFGARYYSNGLGRWVSADWSAKPVPVPYADFGDPQSLNLYSYVGDSPLGSLDPDGHACTAWYGNSGWTGSSGFCARAAEYRKIDANPAIQSRTRFFGAAAIVSNSLGDVDSWRVIVRPLGVSKDTGSLLERIGQTLQPLNEREAKQVASGALGSGPKLDQQLVHIEQTAVQGVLDSFKNTDSKGYEKAINEINGSLNGLASKALQQLAPSDRAYSKVLAGVRKDLNRDINFANQSDREAIGNAETKALRDQKP
jgi:RHS repeat-associated protein